MGSEQDIEMLDDILDYLNVYELRALHMLNEQKLDGLDSSTQSYSTGVW